MSDHGSITDRSSPRVRAGVGGSDQEGIGAERSVDRAEVVGLRIPLVSAKRLSELDSELALVADATSQGELVCSRCQPTEAENAALRQALESLSHENTVLADEIAGLQTQLRRAGSAENALRQELTKVREDDPKSEVIRTVLEHWLRVTGRRGRPGRKPSIAMTTKRAGVVRKALRFHSPEELILAIDGLASVPYVGTKGRKTTGTERERYDEVEHALGDETKVDRFIGYASRAARAAAEQRDTIWDTYWRINALEHHWARLALHATAAVEQGVETDDLEALLLRREEESDARWAEILTVDTPMEIAA